VKAVSGWVGKEFRATDQVIWIGRIDGKGRLAVGEGCIMSDLDVGNRERGGSSSRGCFYRSQGCNTRGPDQEGAQNEAEARDGEARDDDEAPNAE
jgi:hypothetical protein